MKKEADASDGKDCLCLWLASYSQCGGSHAMHMNASRTDELGEFVKSRVSSGRDTSASEVAREALRLMERHEHAEAAKLQWLQQAYCEGRGERRCRRDLDFAALKAEARATTREKPE
uniref:Putative transcriptional regulators, CopG/Arc/MetJ family n=1 Tax=Rhodopseudomonas palustris (strain BisA53) TaxID=316055 RepID=Q07S46_RHOP5